jgi:hypothetical protein
MKSCQVTILSRFVYKTGVETGVCKINFDI